MKPFICLLLALLIARFCVAQNVTSLDNIVKAEQNNHSIHHHKQGAYARSSNAQSSNYNVHYYRLELNTDPAVRYISGSVTTYFSVILDNVNTIEFDVSDSLTVSQVLYHNNQTLSFLQSDNVLSINLPNALNQQQLDSVTVSYSGVPFDSGFGSFVQSTHNDVPIIWTLSEPYGASDWWVCKQSLADKADSLDVLITTPEAYKVASNGLLVAETTSNGNTTYHWQHRYPIATYLVAFAVTNYAVYTEQVNFSGGYELPVLNYVYPENLESAQNGTPALANMLRLYDSLTIPYPFLAEKYGHAQFGWGGGMEHQTMGFMTNFSFDLMAHELAHQWFGDKVTCGGWQDIWLNEGFATYFNALCYQYIDGQQQYWSIWKNQTINNVASQPDGSVFVDDTTDINRLFNGRLTYRKGALLLHMLRWKLGDEAFFGGLRNYLNSPETAYNFARTSNLQHHLEMASGQDLTAFFDQWLYGQGHPLYQIYWQQAANNELTLTINQTQSHPSVAFFAMPLPLRFWGNGVDTTVVVEHLFSGQAFGISLPFVVDSVQFDPERWILCANTTITNGAVGIENETIQSSLNIYPNPANQQLYVQWTPNRISPNPTEINLYDTSGRCVSHLTTTNNTATINLQQLPAGIYVCEKRDSTGIVKQKVMVF